MPASAVAGIEMRRFAPTDACCKPFQGSPLKHLESGGPQLSLLPVSPIAEALTESFLTCSCTRSSFVTVHQLRR